MKQPENKVSFATIHPDGRTSNVRVIKQSDIARCPYFIMMGDHYRDDGSCKCSNKAEREKMIREWKYTEKHFKNIPMID